MKSRKLERAGCAVVPGTLIFYLIVVFAPVGVRAEDAKKPAENAGQKPVAGGAAAQAAGDETAQGLSAFCKMLPVGEKNLDVKIPSFRGGVPNSLVQAHSMTRLDDDHMDMEEMDIRMYGQTREKDLRIQLITATYTMGRQLLSSKQRSRIDRNDFRLEGDTLLFDTRTQQGKMTGNIHMIIYDASTLRQQPEPAGGAVNKGKDKDQDKAQVPAPETNPSSKANPSATPAAKASGAK